MIALLSAFALAAAPVAVPQVEPVGLWENPRATIRVRTAPCGAALCGAIVAAAPTAEADARDAGVTSLIGTELLRDYRQIGPDRWAGTVYVPDMGHSFSSRIVQLSPIRCRFRAA